MAERKYMSTILDVDTILKSMVSFTSLVLYPLGRALHIFTAHEPGHASDTVLMLQRREKSLRLAGNRTPDPRSSTPVGCLITELSRIARKVIFLGCAGFY
jgi:hypothetical protein